MSERSRTPRDGVREQIASGDAVASAVESLCLFDFAVIDSSDEASGLDMRADRLGQVVAKTAARYCGVDRLREIDEHNAAPTLFSVDDRLIERTVEVSRGSLFVLDPTTFHAGGRDLRARAKRAVGHDYTLPFVKQQIEFAGLLGQGVSTDRRAMRLLDLDGAPPNSVETYLVDRRSKLRDRGA